MDMKKKKKKNKWIYDRFDYDLFQDRGCDKNRSKHLYSY